MKYTYFILLMTEMNCSIVECALAPDINLEGSFLTETDSKLLQLTCSTNVAVQLCTVEILINERTYDSIRYHGYNCYHSKSLCSPKICMCSYDCMSFTMNLTVTQDMMNYIYSCASSIDSKGVIYSANISVIQDGNGGLKSLKKFIVPHTSVNPTQQATTTFPPEIRTFSDSIEPVIIAGAVFAFLTFVLLVRLNCQKRNSISKTETREEISVISYPKKKSHTENSAVLDGDRYGFSEQYTQTGEARFSTFVPDTGLEAQKIFFSKQHSQSDSGISSIQNTRFLHMQLEKDRRIRSIPNTRASQMRLEEGDDRPKTFELTPEADGDQYGFSEQYTKTGVARFSAFNPDIPLEVQKIFVSKQHSKSDSGISSIPNTRFRHMPLEKDSRIRPIPNTRASQMRLEEDEDRLEFCAEGQRFRLPPRFSYADSGISSISNTRSRQMQLDGVSETSFIVLKNPYTRIPETIDSRNIQDSTSYTTQFASRSSPPETMPLLDIESNRVTWENPHSCNIVNMQGSDV